MTSERLQAAIHATPFKPFIVHLAGGRSYPVPHPDFVAHRPGGRIAAIITEDDVDHVIDLLLVDEIETRLPTPAGP